MKNKNILILGATGYLGSDLYDYLSKRYSNVMTNTQGVDLTRKENLIDLLQKAKPEIIVNCIKSKKLFSLNMIETCEKHIDYAYNINYGINRDFVNLFHGKIVYFSTDNVFDGKKGAYTEEDLPNPINVYGMTKLFGEKVLIESCDDYLILRMGALYKEKNSGFSDDLNLKDKIICTPSSTKNVCKTLDKLLREDKKGVFHIGGKRKSIMFCEKKSINPKNVSLKSIKIK